MNSKTSISPASTAPTSLSECISCAHKKCTQSSPNTLDICEYGIAYFNNGEDILRKREGITLRHVAQNLRHELHKVLQLIISEACDIDDSVSVREIDLNKPASRIVGATVILDNFIEMIAGVYSFDPYKESETLVRSSVCLFDLLTRYKDTYSLVRNTRRSKSLRFRIDPSIKDMFISNQKHVIEYLVAVLIDNVWKYSIENTPVVIAAKNAGQNLIDLSITNTSTFISQKDKIFNRGYQANIESEGFGFGLYWATMLADHYNSALDTEAERLLVEHVEKKSYTDTNMFQTFTIKNIRID